MLDLYQVLMPAFSIITFLNLLSLKLALKDNVNLSKIYNNKQSVELMPKPIEQQSSAKTMLKFLLLNFTPLQFFIVRRARYKLAFFLSISLITLACYFIQTPFGFTFIGSLCYFTYYLISKAMYSSENEQQNKQESKIYRQKYLQVIFGIISIVLNLLVIGVIFKNYKNTVLNSFITNACINIALDNFIVRPMIVTLIGLPLSRSLMAVNYVKQCQKQTSLLQIYEQIGQKQLLCKPEKNIYPNKRPAKIPVDLEIEPVPINHQKILGIENHIDMLKKIKKDRTLNPINDKLHRNLECELTLNSLFNSNKKKQNWHGEDPLQDQKFNQKNQPEISLSQKKKVCSQNLIMINPSRQEQVENQQEIATQSALAGKINEQQYVSAGHRDSVQAGNREVTVPDQQDQNDPVKISIHSSSQPTSRQQPLRICLKGQINLDLQQNFKEQQEIQIDNYRRRRDIQTIDQNSNRNSFGVLEIKEQNHMHRRSDEIQEIDLNSPERRKRQLHVQLQKESQLGVVKRKKKKFSQDQNQRVIKFSTGEPYLEYLPHMLAKDNNKGKKSQAISKKDIIMDSRASNSVKRPKKRLVGIQNNENVVPQFRIEEL